MERSPKLFNGLTNIGFFMYSLILISIKSEDKYEEIL